MEQDDRNWTAGKEVIFGGRGVLSMLQSQRDPVHSATRAPDDTSKKGRWWVSAGGGNNKVKI